MPLLPILCYHHVGVTGGTKGHPDLWLSHQRFAAQMTYLRENGYRCLSLSGAAEYLAPDRAVPSRAVVLTFDDGYRDFLEDAYPIIREYGFGATVFVVTGAVGGLSRWPGNPEFPLMSWQEIRELHRVGIEFGSHSMTHLRLTRISSAAAEQEVRNSRGTLEDRLGTKVHGFAYPYGSWSPAVERLVEQAGYRVACSMLQGNLQTPRRRFRLKRIAVNEFVSMSQFQRTLFPLFDYRCRLARGLGPVKRLRRWLARSTEAGSLRDDR
jgi:peptidoglycan/xylan/chitin deacetylase (PgdA/CDA1 family)